MPRKKVPSYGGPSRLKPAGGGGRRVKPPARVRKTKSAVLPKLTGKRR